MMRHPKMLYTDFDSKNNKSIAILMKKPCENIGILLAHFTPDLNRKTKSILIDHIFSCDNCYASFRDYLLLSDSMDVFSQDIHHPKTTSKKGATSNWISKSRYIWTKAAIVPIVTIIAIVIFLLSINERSHLNNTPQDSIWRGISLLDRFQLNPLPYSIISRDSLRFNKANKSDSQKWQIFIFDSNLDVIFHSGLLNDHLFIPNRAVRDNLKTGSLYYWKYIEYPESNSPHESSLIPFFVTN